MSVIRRPRSQSIKRVTAALRWSACTTAYHSGRSAYFMEMIAKAGFVGIHAASTRPHVLPVGGIKPIFGTNPLCIGFPSSKGPVIYDIGTASIMVGEVQLFAHIGQELPEGIAFDEHGNPTRDPNAALRGGWVRLVATRLRLVVCSTGTWTTRRRWPRAEQSQGLRFSAPRYQRWFCLYFVGIAIDDEEQKTVVLDFALREASAGE